MGAVRSVPPLRRVTDAKRTSLELCQLCVLTVGYLTPTGQSQRQFLALVCINS